MSTRFLRILVAAGYLLMCLLAGGIMYLWHYEWKEIEALETENQRINNFRQEIHHVYGEMTGLSLLGESVLEWEDEDLEHYHIRRMAVDSMLCRFKTVYPARQIDSVRHLLESKERLLQGIVEVLDEQESLNQRIAERVPVIAARSAQEQPQKSKRKGFLGLFGKKEKPKTTATTNMLHALNSKEIAQQQAQSRRLAAQTNSLAMRNNKLNRQLQSLIGQIDRKIESDLQGREMEITAMRERSFLQIGSLTGCLFLLLVVSYIIMWAKHPAPYPPCGGRFPSTRPQTVLTCLHVYGFPLVTLLFTIVLNHRVAVLTDNQCLAMSFEHQFLPLIIAFQLGESPHMMHDYFSFLTT